MAFPKTTVTTAPQAQSLFANTFATAGAAQPSGGLSSQDYLAWAAAELLSASRLTQAVNTALNTVGAATVTGAGIAGGLTTRGGAQAGAAFTDTTDTATLIIAALPNASIGQSWEYTYQNNTNAQATLANGTGVTVSAITIVPANTFARFLVTYSAASTVTVVGIAMGANSSVPDALWSTTALSGATLTAGLVTGAKYVSLTSTNAAPGSLTTRTAAQMLADHPNAQVGQTYRLRLTQTGAGTLTFVGGTGVTVTGTNTVATNTTRDFSVTFNTATTMTFQVDGTGTFS